MTISIRRDKPTGVVYVNAKRAGRAAAISVVDIGAMIGFHGLVVARVDAETRDIYGLTIEDEDRFRQRALEKYGTDDLRKAATLILEPLLAGARLERAHQYA